MGACASKDSVIVTDPQISPGAHTKLLKACKLYVILEVAMYNTMNFVYV